MSTAPHSPARVLYLLAGISLTGFSAIAQKPVINPGAAVNAASYATGLALNNIYIIPPPPAQPALVSGSIATIFGKDLAAATAEAASVPLPLQLGGASVSVDGVAAPLFYASPGQINFQIPSNLGFVTNQTGIVVTTAGGQSDPYPLVFSALDASGIFAAGASGCGQAAVLNVAPSGAVSMNSPSNSAIPGGFISIFATGLGATTTTIPDGTATPVSPLTSIANGGAGPVFDFSVFPTTYLNGYWEGRAPGLVGADQVNVALPTTVRRGCAVPLQLVGTNISQQLTISIADGGGTCVDPTSQGYGEIVWQQTITTAPPTASGPSVTETDTAAVSLQASPGMHAPVPQDYATPLVTRVATYFGPSCAVPGYRTLDAGTVKVTAPGLAPVTTAPTSLPAGTVMSVNSAALRMSGQVTGLTQSQATLPNSAIGPGSFTASAAGGKDVPAFQATVQIGSPIHITTALAGATIVGTGPNGVGGPPFTINWTGGDANAWVTLKLVGNAGPASGYTAFWAISASAGALTIRGFPNYEGLLVAGPVDLIMEVVPDPSNEPVIQVPGISLGVRTTWKYTYVFTGVTIQ